MVRISKYLTRHLRHDPVRIGITLDLNGWVDVSVLPRAAERSGFPNTPAEQAEVVRSKSGSQDLWIGVSCDLLITSSLLVGSRHSAASCITKVANPSSRRAPLSQASRCSRATVSAWSRSSVVEASRTAQSTSDPVQLNW